MHVDDRRPTTKNPPENFTGDVWLDPVAVPRDDGWTLVANIVRFAPGARTAWHSHPRGQTLYVLEGVAWVQTRGGEKVEVTAGHTVWCPPGEEHWHGATADSFMSHLALNDAGDDPSTTAIWGDHVTNDEYRGGSSPT